MTATTNKRVLIFGIHNTVDWWHYLGRHMGWEQSIVVTDLRGEGDLSVVDDFYGELERRGRRPMPGFSLLTETQKADVLARCRTLRWLDKELAYAMIEAMAVALDRVLDRVRPRVVISFPIDRYVKHVLKLLANARGVPYLELTASVLPSMSMLMRDGQLVKARQEPQPELIDANVRELAAPSFAPSYVPRKATYTKAKFIRTLGYFRARAVALKLISWMHRDPLNLHYLDAQPILGHKCRWKDNRIVDLCDREWRHKLESAPRDTRVLFGLQLFPEASIDYWINNVDLIDHENLVVQAARAFSDVGFTIAVKDHPLQFGFRQTELIDRLRALPNVVIVPYEVTGNELLALCGVNFTFTGTMGLQAALLGIKSIVTESYFSNESDFIVFKARDEIGKLPKRVAETDLAAVPLEQRQRRIIGELLRGSFDGDFFSFKRFDNRNPPVSAHRLAQALGSRLDQLVEEGLI